MRHLGMLLWLLLMLPQTAAAGPTSRESPAPPILIDMHLHGGLGTSEQDWAEVRRSLDRHNVILATLIIEGRERLRLPEAQSPRFLPSPAFPCTGGRYPRGNPCFMESNGWPDLSWLRTQYQSGRLRAMGEMLYVYDGINPSDPRLAPYWALAEELDIPVGVHVGRGPFRRHEGCCPNFNDDLGDPMLLGPVLRRHPRLRAWLMHAGGWDYLDETIALMKAHPGVYAEMSIVNSIMPESMHSTALRALADAGLADRIMFGSDNVPIAPIVERIEAVPFLTRAQKDGIYHRNAARFLRLSATEFAELKEAAGLSASAARAHTAGGP